MKMLKFLIIPLLIVMLLGFGMNSSAELHSKWSSGDLIFYDGTTNIWTIRNGTDGVKVYDDLNLTFGTENDATIKYDDDSTDKLIITCSDGITLSGAITLDSTFAITLTVGEADAIHEALYVLINSEYSTGDWANAIVGRVDYSIAATGSASGGMAAAICAELNMPAQSVPGGAYTAFDAEIEIPANCVMIDSTEFPVSFYRAGLWGAASGEFDDHGYLLWIDGLEDLTTHCWYDNTLKILVGNALATATEWYIPLSSAEASYTTAYPIVVEGGTTGLAFTGTFTTAAINVGVTGATGGIVYSGASDINVGIYSNFTLSTASFFRGLYVLSTYTPSTANDGIASIYGIRGQVNLATGDTHSAGALTDESFVGIHGYATADGTFNGAGLTVAGIKGEVGGTGTYDAVKVVCGVWAKTALSVDNSAGHYTGVYVYASHGSYPADSAMYAWGYFDSGIDLSGWAGGTDGPAFVFSSWGTDEQGSHETNVDGHIKVTVNGDTRFIRLWDDS